MTDNGSSFLAKRFCAPVRDLYTHVRIRYRTPTQLGWLERFHRTFKDEEVYWRLYDNPAMRGNASPNFEPDTTDLVPIGH